MHIGTREAMPSFVDPLGGHTLRVLIAGKMPNEDLDAGA